MKLFRLLVGALALALASAPPARAANDSFTFNGVAIGALAPAGYLPAMAAYFPNGLFSSGNPAYVQGSMSATIGGFVPNGAYQNASVTTSAYGATSLSGLGTSILVFNTGSNNVAFALGGSGVSVSGTTGAILPAGGGCAFSVGSNAYWNAIGLGGSSNLVLAGGSGLASGCWGGGGGGSGGTVAQGAGASASGAWPFFATIGGSAVSASNGFPVSPATGALWAFNAQQWGGATLGAATAWGTVPSGNVQGVNANVLASALPSNAAQETGGNLATVANAQGAGGTGISQPSGGSGIQGWLSGIYSKIAGTLTVGLPSNAAQETGGNLATIANAQGAGGTGISQPSGGSGIQGWLSGILNKLSGTLSVSWSGQSVNQGSGAPTTPWTVGGIDFDLKFSGTIAAGGSISTSSPTITMSISNPGWIVAGMNVYDTTASKQIGTVSAYDGSTTLTLTGNASNNGSGSSDSLFFSWAVANSSHSANTSIGGLLTIPVFRSTAQPSALLAQLQLSALDGQTTSGYTVWLFHSNPTSSTCTDASAISISSNDYGKLVKGFPISLPAPTQYSGVTGFSQISQFGPWPAQNLESTPTINLYACVGVNTTYTPALNSLGGGISGVRD